MRLPGTYPAQGDTRLLTDTLARLGYARGRSVLDVCTGGGAVALAAVRAGARRVTAVDLSHRAVLTARANALLARARVRVWRGDLFEPVQDERFDLVLANPPYVPAETDRLPRHHPGRSWDAGVDGRALLDRICAGAHRVLVPGGRLLLVQSTLSGEEATLSHLRSRGMTAAVAARAPEPFGPVMSARAELLRSRGLLRADQEHEELVVVEARLPVPSGAAARGFGRVV
nr:HemK2/MTQ2 family protein methyltransferase [Kineococcus aurantiacus]